MRTIIKNNWIYFTILAIGTLINNYWVITARNGFLMDDYNWLKLVQFTPVQDIFNFLPNMPYNDRPVGAIFIKILYYFWRSDSFFFHLALLCLHIFNTFMVFVVLKKALIRLQKKDPANIAFTAALIFGMWPNSTMAVQWIAAIFDLLGGTFFLLSTDLFLDATDKKKEPQKLFNILFCLVFYYLGLRTKEMVIVLPVIFLLFHWLRQMERSGNPFKQLSSYRPPGFIFLHLFVMVFYFSWIMILKTGTTNVTTSVESPYYYSFDPTVILVSFFKYITIFFQFSNTSFSFTAFTPVPLICIGLFLILVGYSVFLLAKGRSSLFILCLMVAVALGPVLPMANMQHRLYWYIPSIFMATLMALILNHGFESLGRHKGIYILLLTAIGLFLLTHTSGVKSFRGYWASLCQKDRISIQDIKKMPVPGGFNQIYVQNTSGYNVFFYGPGDINTLIFNRPDLKTYLSLGAVEDATAPIYTMAYHPDGHVDFTGIKSYAELIAINPLPQMKIKNWGPSSVKSGEKFNQQPDGRSAVWIVGVNFNRHAVIIWNGKELLTFQDPQDTVLTASVPDKWYANPGQYPLFIKDTRTGKQTEPVYFQVLR